MRGEAWDGRMSRRRFLGSAGAAGAVLLAPSLARAPAALAQFPGDNVVLQWDAALLQAVRESALGPPMVARALAIAHTCAFDAWAAYDEVAVGTAMGGTLRRPAGERTPANKHEAISYASYRAGVDLFPGSRESVFDPLMKRFGYDPGVIEEDTSKASGIGNLTARAVLEFRYRDGANQLGDEPGGPNGVPYADYTGYTVANDPMDLLARFDPATVHDPDRWQPLRYLDARGRPSTPSFAGPHWYLVTPFALPKGSQFRGERLPGSGRRRVLAAPLRYGTEAYLKQAEAVLRANAGLTDRQKVIAEYWADGPQSELPPGHWHLFAQMVSRRRGHGIDDDVRLFFALSNAIFDAGIVAWDAKRKYDSVRPITAIRYLFAGKKIRAWAGPGKGTARIRGEDWLPYQPSTFPTPPFAEYCSGHSCFSAAGAEILRLFGGTDRFGGSVRVRAGSSKVEPGLVPKEDVVLRWRTFTDASNEAGASRRYGGIHFKRGDLDARIAGRLCGRRTWAKAKRYFDGSA